MSPPEILSYLSRFNTTGPALMQIKLPSEILYRSAALKRHARKYSRASDGIEIKNSIIDSNDG